MSYAVVKTPFSQLPEEKPEVIVEKTFHGEHDDYRYRVLTEEGRRISLHEWENPIIPQPPFHYRRLSHELDLQYSGIPLGDAYIVLPRSTASPTDELFLPWYRAQLETWADGMVGMPPEHLTSTEGAYPKARWVFTLTDDIGTASELCAVDKRIAVVKEPATGWREPFLAGLEEEVLEKTAGVVLKNIVLPMTIAGGIIVLGLGAYHVFHGRSR